VFARTQPPHQENTRLTWSQTDDSVATFRLKSLDLLDSATTRRPERELLRHRRSKCKRRAN